MAVRTECSRARLIAALVLQARLVVLGKHVAPPATDPMVNGWLGDAYPALLRSSAKASRKTTA
jgi:hypothetical protein